MINIRYHIVSITAVFLALGIGVALGSTFFDRATVDLLNRNINSAERRIKATNAENANLSRQLDEARARDDALITDGGPTLLADHLKDVPVLIIAAPGVGKSDGDTLAKALAQSGADLRGTLEMRDPMEFTGGPDTNLEQLLKLDGLSSSELARAVHRRLYAELAAAGAPKTTGGSATSPGRTTTTTEADATTTTTTTLVTGTAPTPDGSTPTVLEALLARDYVRYAPAEGYSADSPLLETTGYRYVFLGAPTLTADQNDALLALLPGPTSTEGLPGTVVSATQTISDGDPIPTPTVVASVRTTDELKSAYSTVDDIETFSGLVATVLTLEDQGTAAPGHYGQADGADAVLPPAS